jgi:hypothetical protein
VKSIDGKTNPEAIPDEVAYRMFLRMAMKSNSEHRERMQRSYIRHVLRTGAVLADKSHANHDKDDCATHRTANPSDEEVTSVLRFVQSYESDLRSIDQRRRDLRMRGDAVKARAMESDVQSVVERAVGRIDGVLDQTTAEKIHLHVRGEFKKKIKIFPKETTTP